MLFFIRDRLQSQAFEPLFLASDFAAGGLSMPLWVRTVAWLGLARACLLGMALANVRGASHLELVADGRILLHRDYVAEELYEKLPVLGVLGVLIR